MGIRASVFGPIVSNMKLRAEKFADKSPEDSSFGGAIRGLVRWLKLASGPKSSDKMSRSSSTSPPSSAPASPLSDTNVSRSASGVSSRQLSLPANPDQGWLNMFPFEVNYNVTHLPASGRVPPSLGDPVLKSALRDAINSRQGVFEWVQQGHNSLAGQLADLLNESGDVDLGSGFQIHDLSCQSEANNVRQWQLLVSAPAMDRPGEMDTFAVPFTEFNVSPRNFDEAAMCMKQSELALQSHLFNVDAPYLDSVENPLVLSSGCDQMADLHALQVEMSSRIQAGLIASQHALVNTLEELTPVFLNSTRTDSSDLILPTLQHQLRVHGRSAEASSLGVLARKRHFFNAQDAAPLPRPNHAAFQRAIRPTTLSLENTAPMCRPSEMTAFRQRAGSNHCGLVAANSFFQAEVMDSTQVINHIVEQYATSFDGAKLADQDLPGLLHPKILEAVEKGEGVLIDRREFLDPEKMQKYPEYSSIFSEHPRAQWRSLLHYGGAVSRGPNGEEYIEVTPDLWVSASAGITVDSLESASNALLAQKHDNPAWSAYPDRVERISTESDAIKLGLEGQIDRLLEQRQAAGSANTQFPIMCMVHGHYFSIARTELGNWVMLDSDGTSITGLQHPSSIFATKGQLGEVLRAAGVIHVICEPLHA